MIDYYKHDEWCIIEEGFSKDFHLASESAFSLGNEYFGQRANFEEHYSGKTLKGSYIAGIYYPDKTKVGWWKNGYPDYFAKLLNAPSWIGIYVEVDGEVLDLDKIKVENFRRTLNMKEGYLEREFIANFANGNRIFVKTKRFLSFVDRELGMIKYQIKNLGKGFSLKISPSIDGDVINEAANWEKHLWDIPNKLNVENQAYLFAMSKKLNFEVCTAMTYDLHKNGEQFVEFDTDQIEFEKLLQHEIMLDLDENDTINFFKYSTVTHTENYPRTKLQEKANVNLLYAFNKGFDKLFEEHKNEWARKWASCDIVIDGDITAQQAIRFNIFHLLQTYSGHDSRLNLSPKGFTGEKYGGGAYWDTEAFCFPFYLGTSYPDVAKNLLLYRYNHLSKAIENAEKLGFTDGAALYPMVTMNGEECHNEWEITFEEIHRNGAIAYAIFNYANYTGDTEYISDYGLEVLIAIARFWAQRFNFSEDKKQYVMLGVTGPNEYENNVHNNWYTSKIAQWCLIYTGKQIEFVKTKTPEKYKQLVSKTNFDESSELANWSEIASNVYFPEDKKRGVFLQQDGFLDKELKNANELDESERPINQHWSWDRILRSCFIKQADVLQGLYFFEDEYDKDTLKRNFDFYEPMTVHESSLSPSLHAVLANSLGYTQKAYEMFLRSSRYDLDDFNNELHEGCHITSMAGSWLVIIEGFGGRRVRNNKLYLNPAIPEQWKSYSFNFNFKQTILKVAVDKSKVIVENQGISPIGFYVYDKDFHLEPGENTEVKLRK